MLPNPTLAAGEPLYYPESDGKPLAESTKQLQWIVVLYNNLCMLFENRDDVFVAANQFWYPVEGHPEIVQAPDPYVVFGRPKGHRPSYKQWEEGHVPITVVFEILPSNEDPEMAAKLLFYEEYGVEEYYIYDPEKNLLTIYLRKGSVLSRHRPVQGFKSPRLKISFDVSGPEMVVSHPDGRRFLTFEELEAQRRREAQRAEQAEQRADAIAQERDETKQRADALAQERDKAKQQVDAITQERDQAKQRAERADEERDQAKQRADRMEQRAARLAELTRKNLRGQATSEELEELARLLEDPPAPS